jgi:hypothetical protein
VTLPDQVLVFAAVRLLVLAASDERDHAIWAFCQRPFISYHKDLI